MEQGDRAVLDRSEGKTEQGGEAPAVVLAGKVADDAAEGSTEPERVPGAALVSVQKGDLEEPLPESDGVAAAGNGGVHGAAASGSVKVDYRGMFQNPIATQFEFRAAVAHATPPSTSRRAPSRSRKQAAPTKSIAAGDAELAGSETPVLSASSSAPMPVTGSILGASSSAPAPVTGPEEDVSAMSGGDQGATPGADEKQREDCFVPGAMVAIAHASPPDSFRLRPSRSRKQSAPERFIAAGAPESAASAPAPPAGLGSTLPSASSSASATNPMPPSISRRVPSRSRKQAAPTKSIAAGDAELTGSGTPVLGASSSAPTPVTGPPEDVSALSGGDQGAAPGDDEKQRGASFVPGAMVAIAHPSPPDSFRFRPSRSRKQYAPERFIAAGAPAPAASDQPLPAGLGSTVSSATSSAPAPVTGPHEDVSAMASGDEGAAPGDDKKQNKACVPGAMVAIAHASPPDSFRLQPSRSRKQYAPERFNAAGAPARAAAPAAGDPPLPAGAPGSTLPSASASGHRAATLSASDATASSAASSFSSSYHLSSRGRKQPRAEHFDPEEAEARARAKARRSNTILDRFLTSLVHGSSESKTEWVRNVTADDVRGQQRQRSIQGFKIRDVSRHAARVRELRAAISHLGATCCQPSCSARPRCASHSPSASPPPPLPGSPPGELDGSARIYCVLAVLGASLCLSVASCVLFYIVGRRSKSGPPGEQEE